MVLVHIRLNFLVCLRYTVLTDSFGCLQFEKLVFLGLGQLIESSQYVGIAQLDLGPGWVRTSR